MSFLIRISPDRRLLASFPEHFGGCTVLHRLCTPSHPPYTLSSLTTLTEDRPPTKPFRVPSDRNQNAVTHLSPSQAFASYRVTLRTKWVSYVNLRSIIRLIINSVIGVVSSDPRISLSQNPHICKIPHHAIFTCQRTDLNSYRDDNPLSHWHAFSETTKQVRIT